MKLRINSTGIISVKVPTPKGYRIINTGCKDRAEALKVLKDVSITKIAALSKAGQLTLQIIQKLTVNGNIGLNEAFEEWDKWLHDTSNSDRTSESHVGLVRHWIKACGIKLHRLHTVTPKQISQWVNTEDNIKLSSRCVRLAAVRSFFRYCTIRDYINQDPSREVRVKTKNLTHEQKEPRVKRVFTNEEFDRLTNTITGQRVDLMGMSRTPGRVLKAKHLQFWQCAVVIGRYSGLRLGDIARLEWASLRDPEQMVVWTDKKDTRVSIPIGEELRLAIAQIPAESSVYCFPDQQKIHTDVRRRSSLSVQFARLLRDAKLSGHSFHDLRHTLATELNAKGHSMKDIAKALGHTNTSTTEVY